MPLNAAIEIQQDNTLGNDNFYFTIFSQFLQSYFADKINNGRLYADAHRPKDMKFFLAAEEFPFEEGTTFFDPVLFFHKGDVLFGVVDVVVFEPDVEEEFADEAVDAGFIGVPARDVDAFFDFKEDGKEPLHVGVVEVAAHDEHVEHVGPRTVHDFFKGRQVFGTLFLDDCFRQVQAFAVMGVVVMGAVCFNVVFSLVRHDDGMLGQEGLPFFFRKNLLLLCFHIPHFFARKIATVVDKPQVIGIQVFPGPVKARQFTKMRILGADIVARVVWHIANRSFAFGTDMDRQINRIRRHPVLFVSCNDNFNRQNGQSFLFYSDEIISIRAVLGIPTSSVAGRPRGDPDKAPGRGHFYCTA